MTVPGIVLAAGASTRMGRPKAFLPMTPGGTVLGRVLGTLADAGVSPIIVVARAVFRVEDAWRDPRAGQIQVVLNPDPDRGQMSSLVCGLQHLGPQAPCVLMTLVDIPLVHESTVRALLDAWRDQQAPLVRPVHDGRRGHPVIFGRPLLDALAAADPAAGARPVVRAFAVSGVDVPVDDPGILIDLDTPDEYARHA